jgi:hypothetical protein
VEFGKKRSWAAFLVLGWKDRGKESQISVVKLTGIRYTSLCLNPGSLAFEAEISVLVGWQALSVLAV